MNASLRITIASLLLIAAMITAFIVPKTKYRSTNILNELAIPTSLTHWRSRDYSKDINNSKDDRYNFLSQIIARIYAKRSGENLLLIILDAANFHHPKVCFNSSGFRIKELSNIPIILKEKHITAQTFYAEKGKQAFLVVFWMVINGKETDWAGQKFQELLFTLLNKKRAGLMIRMDIPLKGEQGIAEGINLAKEFLNDLNGELPTEQAGLVFGKRAP